jgi:arylsulfatase A-like enzyme
MQHAHFNPILKIAGLSMLVLSVCLSSCNSKKESKPLRPNIIYILADDMGYGDVEALNPECKIPTPNLNKMAEEGIVFTDAHSSSAVCSPSRYGVLSGR